MITLPVYLNLTKTKSTYISMNWFRNAHFHSQNKAKKMMHELLIPQLTNFRPVTLYYSVLYVYYYKNVVSDLPNAGALASKFFNDSLQTLNLVPNDNVKYLLAEHYVVGGQDKSNPRIEIHIKEYTDEPSFNNFRSQLISYFQDSNLGH